MFCAVGVMAPSVSHAQKTEKKEKKTKTTVDQALAGLINVAVGSVTVGDITLVTLNGITLENLVIVDVQDVLNDNKIDILRNAIQDITITIDDTLNNLLRDANIITDNQIVVGVLSGGIILVDDL